MKTLWFLPLASAIAASPAFAGMPSAERQAQLHDMVVQDCGSCHGLTMRGGLGKSLLPADLADTSDQAVAAVILDGVSGTPMPPWRGLIDDDEALWIARLLKQGLNR